MINHSEIETYKKQLEARRDELMREIIEESKPVNFGEDTIQSGEEKADEAESFADQLAVAQTLRQEVQDIDDALARIRHKKYGTCEKCGGDISREVLSAAPESSLCEQCKLEI
jgi:RNA polymerase-binding transcription factor DksA